MWTRDTVDRQVGDICPIPRSSQQCFHCQHVTSGRVEVHHGKQSHEPLLHRTPLSSSQMSTTLMERSCVYCSFSSPGLRAEPGTQAVRTGKKGILGTCDIGGELDGTVDGKGTVALRRTLGLGHKDPLVVLASKNHAPETKVWLKQMLRYMEARAQPALQTHLAPNTEPPLLHPQSLLLAPCWCLVETPCSVALSRSQLLQRPSAEAGWGTGGSWARALLGGLHMTAAEGNTGGGAVGSPGFL